MCPSTAKACWLASQGVGAGVETRREEEEAGEAKQAGTGALGGRGEGSQAGRVPARPWPSSSRQCGIAHLASISIKRRPNLGKSAAVGGPRE